MRGWLRLFPKPWRDRYGAEVEEALSRSGRSALADGVDLLVAAAAVWADHVAGRRTVMRMLRAGALALVALGLVTVGWAVTELQDGITELPRHWWSSLAAVPLLGGLIATWLAWRPRRTPQGA